MEEELGSVVFLMDYLQLDFSNARISAYVWPVVSIGDVRRELGDPGYRDALCALIAHEVVETEESSEAGLVIRFGLGEVIINPGPTDLRGPEIAMLQVHEDAFGDASWAVWQPGEGVFAGRDWPSPRRPHLGYWDFPQDRCLAGPRSGVRRDALMSAARSGCCQGADRLDGRTESDPPDLWAGYPCCPWSGDKGSREPTPAS